MAQACASVSPAAVNSAAEASSPSFTIGEKLARSIRVALRKRPVERERVDRMITGIVRRLESMGENEIPANMIGELVMQALASLDKVAFHAGRQRSFRRSHHGIRHRSGLVQQEQDVVRVQTRQRVGLLFSTSALGPGPGRHPPLYGCLLGEDAGFSPLEQVL
jgi:hypothetical protein